MPPQVHGRVVGVDRDSAERLAIARNIGVREHAVAAAYGWPEDISTDDALARLLALNLERAVVVRDGSGSTVRSASAFSLNPVVDQLHPLTL